MNDTKERLKLAAAEIVAEQGLSSATARAIGERAGVNQALVFYHFGTVSDLVEEASNQAVAVAVERYRSRFDGADSLGALLRIGRELHEHEQSVGNVALMGQLMANASRDAAIARAARHAMTSWVREIERVVVRVLADSPVADLVDPHGLSCAVAASFIGMELYETVDAQEADGAMKTLAQLGVLVDALNELGPLASRALKGTRIVSGLKSGRSRSTRR